ncbi:hypothetical protein E4U21_000251 [Claviceps maximensis]|nr:hypothetical protein E4U21_000251 [Claviceps maximensis]
MSVVRSSPVVSCVASGTTDDLYFNFQSGPLAVVSTVENDASYALVNGFTQVMPMWTANSHFYSRSDVYDPQ